jgi:sugar/nucleoside kinase (ribokinase family)
MFDIITIGTATRDVFLTSPLFKVLRDKKHLPKIGFPTAEAQCFALGGKIEVNKPIFTTGGGATNTAVTFNRQGLRTATLIRIGKDEASRAILEELTREKITPLAVRDKNQASAYSVILLTKDGERTILVYRGASDDLKIKEIPFKKLESRWAYISPGNISYPVIEKLFNHFSKNKTLIAFNPSRYFLEMGIKKLKSLLNKTKVAILNREEASYLTGIDYQKEKEIFKKLDREIDGIAVMTEGGKGVLVSDGKNIYSAGVLKGKLIDRLGAGDAFGAGFIAGLLQNQKSKIKNQKFTEMDIKYAIRLGSANATSVIEKIGAKEGILSKNSFRKNPRWRSLGIRITKIY